MSVRTVFEVRSFFKIAGACDFVETKRYDELESDVAKAAYTDAEHIARDRIGTSQVFVTEQGNEVEGEVVRCVVELIEAKTDSSRQWGHRVVGSDEHQEGMRLFLEAAKEAKA